MHTHTRTHTHTHTHTQTHTEQIVADSIQQALSPLAGEPQVGHAMDSTIPGEYVDPQEDMMALIRHEMSKAIVESETNDYLKQLRVSIGGCKCTQNCTRESKDRSWCPTYGECGEEGAGGRWDYCEHELVTTIKGCHCKFPFRYIYI
jgi:hypothetical protein